VIRAALRLLLLLAVLAGISALQGFRKTGVGPAVLLAGAALLLTGLFAGKVAVGVRAPRLTGYLLIGIAVGPNVLGFLPTEGVAGLDLVKGLAVSLIALTAGTELRLGLIRRVGARVAALCGIVTAVVFAASFAAAMALRPALPFLAGVRWPQAAAMAALMATMIVSFSPTVTIAIVQETRARGPLTEFLMAFVIIGDLVVMIAFAVAAAIARGAFGGQVTVGVLAGGIGWELFGSVFFGAAIGMGVLLYLKRVGREVPLVITGLSFALAEAGLHLELSPLLLSLAAGAVIANLDEHVARRLHHAIAQVALPVFALFFAATGAGLHLGTLRQVGLSAALLVGLRALAIYGSCRRFAGGEDEPIRRNLWLGLISQAGVTVGLAALVARGFPGFGPEVEALVVAMVTLNELAGPLCTRRALSRAGEIRAPEAVKV